MHIQGMAALDAGWYRVEEHTQTPQALTRASDDILVYVCYMHQRHYAW